MKKYTLLLFSLLFLLMSGKLFSQISKKYKSPKEFFKEAKQADAKGDFRKSADISIQGLKQHPYYIDLKQQLGKSYLNLKKMDSARYYLKIVADQEPNNVAVRHYLVNLEFTTKRYSSAICYVNELLEKTPYWKSLWFKKILIYKEMGNHQEVIRATKRLRQIFPNDTLVQKYYKNIMLNVDTKNIKKKDFEEERNTYLDILKAAPNKKTFLSLIKLEINEGKHLEALEYIEKALLYFPKDIALIKKKVSLLTDSFRYDAALSYLKLNKKVLPKNYYRRTERYLTLLAARYYENTDPYILHQKSYNLNRNFESFNFLLNKSFERGYYEETLNLIRDGLKRNANSKKLLVKQMMVYKAQKDTPKFIKLVKELFKGFPNDYDIRQEYAQILNTEAKSFLKDKQYQLAIYKYNDLLSFKEFESIAKNGLFSVYALQNKFPLALDQINLLIKDNPDKPIFQVKKAELLKNHKDFEGAIKIAENLYKKYPKTDKFKQQYLSYLEEYISVLNTLEDYPKASLFIETYLANDKNNLQIYLYGINNAFAQEDYPKMLAITEKGLTVFPDNINLKLKEITANSLLEKYPTVEKLVSDLSLKFPSNTKVKNVLIDEKFKMAVLLEKTDPQKAITYYQSILEKNPKHIATYKRLVNLYIKEKKLTQAMLITDKALKKLKNEKPFFYYKKGLIYELQGDFKNAYYYQKKSQKKKEVDLTEHLNYLFYSKLKNTVGVDYLSTTLNENNIKSAIGTVFYLRSTEKNNYGAFFSYAPRVTGVGLQFHAQWSHKFSKTIYTQFDGFLGKKFFPNFKIKGSIFKYFKKDWEGEFGLGYTKYQNGTNVLNTQFGVSKIINDFWLNAKINLLFGDNKTYNNILAQGRYTTNERGDVFFVMGAMGNVAQDDTFSYQIDSFTTYTNSVIGAGYKWKIKSKYSFSIVGNLYNFKVSNTDYIEQYHLYFSVQTKF